MPRALSASAISRSVRAPAFLRLADDRQHVGRVAVCLGLLRINGALAGRVELRVAQGDPRALAADRACRFRVEMSARSFSASAMAPSARGGQCAISSHGSDIVLSILPKPDRVTLFELSGCLDGHARGAFSSKTLLDRICSHVVWATTCFASIGDGKWQRVL
jgi:hypothetical protein